MKVRYKQKMGERPRWAARPYKRMQSRRGIFHHTLDPSCTRTQDCGKTELSKKENGPGYGYIGTGEQKIFHPVVIETTGSG